MNQFSIGPSADGLVWWVSDFSGCGMAKFYGEAGKDKARWIAAALNYCIGVEAEELEGKKFNSTEPLLVAPPVTKGKAESHTHPRDGSWDAGCPACIANAKLNQVADDYDLTSNDTRRGD